jgi:hypothetical protein
VHPNDNMTATSSIVPASAATASAIGTAVDWSGHNAVVGVISLGEMAASATVAAVLEESDDGATNFVEIDALDLVETDKNKAHRLGGIRQASSRKKVRVRCQRSGASMLGAAIVLAEPKQAPVS